MHEQNYWVASDRESKNMNKRHKNHASHKEATMTTKTTTKPPTKIIRKQTFTQANNTK